MDKNKIEFEKKIYEFEELKSTNDWMIENLKKSNLKEGTVVVTLNQSDGRGMRNSRWFSEKNKSLTFSLLLKPNFLKLDYLFDLSICVSISIIEVLHKINNNFKLKWPNDIYFDKYKVGGILIENQINKNKLEKSIVGIGLNINNSNFTFLENSSSLFLISKKKYKVKDIMLSILGKIEERYNDLICGGYEKLKKKYLKNLLHFNIFRDYIEKDGSKVNGKICNVDRRGFLIIEFKNGYKKKYFHKEIKFI